MVIVAGHLMVAPDRRDAYLNDCVAVIEQARAAPGCLDFSLTGDLVDRGRINIFERWDSQGAVDAFRGSGPGEDQSAVMISGSVSEYDVGEERVLM